MAAKKIRDRTEFLFFQHPFKLEEDERIKNLKAMLGFEGMGIFWEVYRRIRLGGGQYPLDSIFLMADDSDVIKEKVGRVLTEFNLFVVDLGMVSMGSGLTVKAFKKKCDTVGAALAKVEELSERSYADTLMPEELAEMDAQAKEQLQQKIHEHNAEAVRELIDFV